MSSTKRRADTYAQRAIPDRTPLASLPPGDYTLKLAVAEGDRVGTVEHVIHAALPNGGGLAFSELMVGGPHDVGELLTPTIGYDVTFGILHGYVEVYGPRASGVTVEYEIATEADAPALLNVDVPPYPAGDERVIFTTKSCRSTSCRRASMCCAPFSPCRARPSRR